MTSCIQDCCSFLFESGDNQEREPLNRSRSSAPARRQRREAVASRRAHPQSARSVEQTGLAVDQMVVTAFLQDGEVKFQIKDTPIVGSEQVMIKTIRSLMQEFGPPYPISFEGRNENAVEIVEAIGRVMKATGLGKKESP